MVTKKTNFSAEIKKLLGKSSGMSVKEISKALHVNRHFTAGFLSAMEEMEELFSKKVGPAKVYFNNRSEVKENLMDKPKKVKKIGFNQLTPSEWARLSKSVWNDVSSTRKKYHLEHGATFSQAMAERVITLFTKKGDWVLDPFVGTGTTLVAANKLHRNGVGFEIYSKFIEIANNAIGQQTLATIQRVIHDDCRNLLNYPEYVSKEKFQLMLTSPPYANFIHKSIKDRQETHKTSMFVLENKSVVKPYGDDARDFGNLPYDLFLNEIKELMKKLLEVTAPGGYNVWVVKDVRDTINGKPYIDFHSDIAHIGEEVGFRYHDLIIWDQGAQRKLVVLGFPSVFYTNINHTFLVVLRKPQNAK